MSAAKPTQDTAPGIELVRLADALHHAIAYRAGAIAQAAFKLAQHKEIHSEVCALADCLPEVGQALHQVQGWREPADDDSALPELLRELCTQMGELARDARNLTNALGGHP
jgi:hypothetical protein